MQTWISLTLNDVRNVLRDRLLLAILFVPAILLAFVRGLMPFIISEYPTVADYRPIILMLATAQIPTTFGLIASFVMLDEKDENLFPVLRSLPVSANRFLGFRLGWVFALTTLGAAMFLTFSGLATLSQGVVWQTALLYGLLSIVLTLLIVTYTANKVEGLAVFKGINIAMYLPVLPWFWDTSWLHALALIPSYWPYRILGTALAGSNTWPWFAMGLSIISLSLFFLLKEFRRRVFT